MRKCGFENLKFEFLIIFCVCFLFVCYLALEPYQNSILSDALDIAPRDNYAVFGREGRKKPIPRKNHRVDFACAGVEFEVANTSEQTAVTDVYDLLASKLGKRADDVN